MDGELAFRFLKNTPLLELFDMPVAFSIPRPLWSEHAAIFAPTGRGKSQTLGHLVHGFLNEPDPPGMFIMSGIGKMHTPIEGLQCVDRMRRLQRAIQPPTWHADGGIQQWAPSRQLSHFVGQGAF